MHPRMMALNGKIDFLRDRLEYFRRNSSIDSSRPNDFATRTAAASHDGLEKSRSSLNKMKSLEEQYSELKRDLDGKADFHHLVRKEAQQWNIKTRTISNNIIVIDGPRVGAPPWWKHFGIP